MDEIGKSVSSISINDWILVKWNLKKSCHYYVGQVMAVNISENEAEAKFLRKVKSLNPLASTTFAWADPEDCSIVSLDDIEKFLPAPTMTGRRGLMRFEVDFSTYNVL